MLPLTRENWSRCVAIDAGVSVNARPMSPSFPLPA